MTYAQSAIDQFSDPQKLPQIAISVDMLDTGIDVPEVLNLVFFKKVMSKAKFWQMIGRGTRLCPGLLDGADKEKFYIFDLCGNFEFFRMSKGKAAANQLPLQSAIFSLKAQIVYQLQELACQTEDLIPFRERLVGEMLAKVGELNRENFAVRQHLRYVEKFADPNGYTALSYEDTLCLRDEVAPLLQPDVDEAGAVRFDALMYGIELACLIGKTYTRARSDLLKKVSSIASIANVPEIGAQSELIEQILHMNYLDTAGINEFEHIRECLRGNIPLTAEDVDALEHILWSEVGTQQEYEDSCGHKPLGEFVREIVGLDMNAAKLAFSDYLNNASLDGRQIYFVNQIIEYIVRNGMMKDLSVLQEPPFTDQGSVVEVFADLSVWLGIRAVIDRINANALGAKNI